MGLVNYFDLTTNQLVRVDVTNGIMYDWYSNVPKKANLDNLRKVATEIRSDKKRFLITDILKSYRNHFVLCFLILCATIVGLNVNITPNNNTDNTEIKRVSKIIIDFDTQNRYNFGDWRVLKILQESIGKTDTEIQGIIENNYMEIKNK